MQQAPPTLQEAPQWELPWSPSHGSKHKRQNLEAPTEEGDDLLFCNQEKA